MLVLLVKENIKLWITVEDKEVKITYEYLIDKPLYRKWLNVIFLWYKYNKYMFPPPLAQPNHDPNTHHCLCGADGKFLLWNLSLLD